MWILRRPEYVILSSATGVTDSCEPATVGTENSKCFKPLSALASTAGTRPQGGLCANLRLQSGLMRTYRAPLPQSDDC